MNQGLLQAVLRTVYKQKTVMYKGGKKKKTAASAIQQRFVIDELLLAILFFPFLLSIDVAVYFVV